MKKGIRVGKWNVLSAHRSGAPQNLIHLTQEYRTGLLVVQEVKWLRRNITEIRLTKSAIVLMIKCFWDML